MRFGALYDSDTGALERRIPVGKRPIFADIEVKDGRLSYRPFGELKFVSADDQSRKLLENFLNLAEASDNEIQAYARKNSVLGLCAHGLPAGHESLRGRLSFLLAVAKQKPGVHFSAIDWLAVQWLKSKPAKIDAPCFPELLIPEIKAALLVDQPPADAELLSSDDVVLSEPVGLWRVYALLAGELLKVAAEGCEQDRGELTETLDHWLALTPLRPCCVLDKRGRLALRLQAVNPFSALFGVLGAQLFSAASGGKSWLVCSGCGKWYQPDRQPRTGVHTYCPACGKNAAWRAASRRYYAKRKGEN
jgi:hypothetical protein